MLRVKRISHEDTTILEQITTMEAKCFPDPWSFEMFQLEAQRKGGVVLAALDENDTVAGYLTAQVILDTADINIVAVDPDRRRQSIGSLLLGEFLEGLATDTQVFLEVRISNEPAIALYQKFGFQKIGIRKQYYSHPTEDAILMQFGGISC